MEDGVGLEQGIPTTAVPSPEPDSGWVPGVVRQPSYASVAGRQAPGPLWLDTSTHCQELLLPSHAIYKVIPQTLWLGLDSTQGSPRA